MRLVILPEWGGKIVSIYDKHHDREWLHTNHNFLYRLPTYDSNYVRDFDIGGFDECFPNIGAGSFPGLPWQGVALPDHGEVWALPWDVDLDGDGLTLRVEGVRLPYTLEKRLELRSEGLWMHYQAINLSPFDMPVLWSSHPLMDVKPGMRLEVPASSVRIDSCSPRFSELTRVKTGQIASWPLVNGQDLSIIPGPEARISAKLIARELREGRVALVDPEEGASLTFRFNQSSVTHCGLWLNYCGWAGKPGAAPYYNIGFEPCIGGADRLDLAVQVGEAGLLPAKGELSWYLQLDLR